MSIRDWLYHRHYWGLPHKREGDSRLVQICYECGKEREVQMDLSSNDEGDQKGDIQTGGERDERIAFTGLEPAAIG
ncbi:MAG TPA: hypothetical protein VNH22_12865 [Blastocatellia bacterium]|jgi:hypothetical protein|nr:hypothetical protein [Blastocatellia bacterium]